MRAKAHKKMPVQDILTRAIKLFNTAISARQHRSLEQQNLAN